MDELEFDNMKMMLVVTITDDLAERFGQPASVECSVHGRFVYDSISLRVIQRVFGKQVLYKKISYPADWKQAFKERWFPAWAKKRWPVCYETRTLDVREVVPSLDIPGHKSLIVTTLGA